MCLVKKLNVGCYSLFKVQLCPRIAVVFLCSCFEGWIWNKVNIFRFIYWFYGWLRVKKHHTNEESIVKWVVYIQVHVQICLNSAEYRPYLMFLYWFSFGVKVPFTFPFFIVLKSNGIPDPCWMKTRKQCSC